jgi:hypothetical protein
VKTKREEMSLTVRRMREERECSACGKGIVVSPGGTSESLGRGPLAGVADSRGCRLFIWIEVRLSRPTGAGRKGR